MIEAAEQAQALVSDVGMEALRSDRQRRDALGWNFTVLGEAAAQLDEAVKNRFADVHWAQPSRLRNRIVHGYWAIDLEVVHTTASTMLPDFIGQLRAVLSALETEPTSPLEPED